MKLKSVLVIIAVSLTGILPSLSRAELPSNYLVIKAGIYSPSNEVDLNNIQVNGKEGFAGEVAIGHYFIPELALEIGAGYFDGRGLKVVPVVATGKALLPLPVVEPYILGGIGAYLTNFDANITSSNASSTTKITYGLHAGAGLNFNITDIFYLGAEGKYIWSQPSLGGQDIKLDGFIVTGDIGFRF